jgi:hypothetical protein
MERRQGKIKAAANKGKRLYCETQDNKYEEQDDTDAAEDG